MGTNATAGEPVRILIADDEPEIRRVLEGLVKTSRAFKANVEAYPNGEEAIARLEQAPFDVVISDYRMMEKTGIDVLEKAADLYPASGRVLITGYSEMDIAVDAVNRGRISGFVRKPWDSADFRTLIEELAGAAQKGAATATAPASAATRPSGVAAPADPAPADLKRKVQAIELEMRKLRVKFGVGGIGAEAYKRIMAELTERRAQLEYDMLRS